MSTSNDAHDATPKQTVPRSDNSWCERPNAEKIPCPALLALYNNGLLKPDEDGNVSVAHLDEVLASVGISAAVRDVLITAGDKTDSVPDSFNLFALRESRLDHHGSTGIRDPDVSPEKLEDALLKFSENGRMYSEHFAAAANHAGMQDPDIVGTGIQTVEFSALLEVFGRVDESRKRYLTVDDVRGLWIAGKFPADWQPRAADEIDVVAVTAQVAVMAVKRVLKAIGL